MTPSFDEDGLVPAVVQDARSGRVLMLGYLNQEAIDLTLSTGLVHFWSRSRQRLWQKGETSGNHLHLVEIASDCDADALLIEARPSGPVCHTGQASCFDDLPPDQGFAWLERLWRVVEARAQTRPEGSYTARLMAGGVDTTARKLVEEAVEVLLAAKDHAAGVADHRRLAEEAADLVYHLLVVMGERGVAPEAMITILEERSISG